MTLQARWICSAVRSSSRGRGPIATAVHRFCDLPPSAPRLVNRHHRLRSCGTCPQTSSPVTFLPVLLPYQVAVFFQDAPSDSAFAVARLLDSSSFGCRLASSGEIVGGFRALNCTNLETGYSRMPVDSTNWLVAPC